MTSYTIQHLTEAREAEHVSRFMLSADSFDDQRFTPGEVEQLTHHPLASVDMDHYDFVYARTVDGHLIGVISYMENEQKTKGYLLEYLAVHRDYRKMGIASALIDHMFEDVRNRKGRYIIAYTCDLPAYRSVQRLFLENGFRKIGMYADYYFPGEGRLSYYKSLGPVTAREV